MTTFGPAFSEALDGKRIRGQIATLRDVMLSASECGAWLTLAEIHKLTGYPESSVSADLRHLRKKEFGAYLVEKRRRGTKHGLAVWEYRVLPAPVRFEQLSLLGATR